MKDDVEYNHIERMEIFLFIFSSTSQHRLIPRNCICLALSSPEERSVFPKLWGADRIGTKEI